MKTTFGQISWKALLSVGLLTVAAVAAEAPLDAAAVDRAVDQAAPYHLGASRAGFNAVDQIVRATRPGDPLRLRLETRLAELAASDTDREARRLACRVLWIIGAERSLPVLVELLNDPAHTDMACFALRNHPAPEVNKALLAALKKLDGPARIAVVNLLGDRRVAEAVPALSGLARAPDPTLAGAALASLGRIGSPQAAQALARMTEHGAASPALLNALLQCAQQLEQRGVSHGARRIYHYFLEEAKESRYRVAGFLGLVRLGGDEAVRQVAAALDDDDARLAATALARIPELEGGEITSRFLKQLNTLPPEREAGLLRALAQRKNPALLPVARARATRQNEAVAVAALEALGVLGDSASAPLLIAAVNGDSAARRAAALASLRRLPHEATVDQALAQSLAQAAPTNRVALIQVLAARRAGSAVPVLLHQARASEPEVALAAFKALGRLADPKMLPALLDALAACPGDPVPTAAVEAVLRVARKASAEPVALLVAESYAAADRPAVRVALLDVLGGLANPVALSVAMAARHDAAPAVREHAVRLLADWRTPEVLPLLLHLARNETRSTQRILALRGAVRLLSQAESGPPADRLRHFQEMLELAGRDEERRVILGGLGQSGLPAAGKLIAPLLDSPTLRAEAASALITLARGLDAPLPPDLRAALERIAPLPVPDSLKQQAAARLQKP